MSNITYNKTNFHKHTFCVFSEASIEIIKDLKLNFKSKSGSSYYFVENGVYRLSNHWARVANCKWRLINFNENLDSKDNKNKLGFAKWTDFYQDNDFEKLYFVEVNYDAKIVNFYHRRSENYNEVKILRTAGETAKLIKQIRILFDQTAWTKYLKTDVIDVVRKEIIENLINSNQSFHEIRRAFL